MTPDNALESGRAEELRAAADAEAVRRTKKQALEA